MQDVPLLGELPPEPDATSESRRSELEAECETQVTSTPLPLGNLYKSCWPKGALVSALTVRQDIEDSQLPGDYEDAPDEVGAACDTPADDGQAKADDCDDDEDDDAPLSSWGWGSN